MDKFRLHDRSWSIDWEWRQRSFIKSGPRQEGAHAVLSLAFLVLVMHGPTANNTTITFPFFASSQKYKLWQFLLIFSSFTNDLRHNGIKLYALSPGRAGECPLRQHQKLRPIHYQLQKDGHKDLRRMPLGQGLHHIHSELFSFPDIHPSTVVRHVRRLIGLCTGWTVLKD